MTEHVLFSLGVRSRAGTAMAAGAVADAGVLLGLTRGAASRLAVLAEEVAELILAEAFEGVADDEIDLDVTVQRRPGGLAVLIRDRGAPTRFRNGSYPARIADLVRLGFADGLEFEGAGRDGNVAVLTKSLPFAVIATDSEFLAEAGVSEGVQLDDRGEAVLQIRPMTPQDAVGVARLFYRTYGYTAAYAQVVYEPERLGELVAAGLHRATVALTPSGRVVAHISTTLEHTTAVVGKVGLLAVEPDYRRHRVGARIGAEHLRRAVSEGFAGLYTEAVTNHTGSQRIAIASGAGEVGLVLAGQSPELRFRSLEDDDENRRRALMLYYGPLPGERHHRDVHVPPSYGEAARRIYAGLGLARTVHHDYRRPDGEIPEQSEFSLSLRHETGVAMVKVDRFGADFLAALQARVSELRLNRYDLIIVTMPMSDPLTGYLGGGLQELGLSFCGIFPEYDEGDVLLLQNLNNVDVDPAEIRVVSAMGEYLRDIVVADFTKGIDRTAQRRRSRARMARIYEAFQGDGQGGGE